METTEKLENLIKNISPESLKAFLKAKSSDFSAGAHEDLSHYNDAKFTDFQKVGELRFDDGEKAIAIIVTVNDTLTERACRKAQYDKAKKLLKDFNSYPAGIFVFCDTAKNFRFSLVYEQTLGARRTFNNFRRYTFYIDPAGNNKTFRQQLSTASFNSFNGSRGLRDTFSVNAVTKAFYDEFKPNFDEIVSAVHKKAAKVSSENTRQDLALLFVIRTIFLGFIQKRKWIGDDENFIQSLWVEYKKAGFEGKNLFYQNWLEPLFFDSLSSPAGRVLPSDKYDFSKETQKKLQFAPYLNGGLFKRKPKLDDEGYHITDKAIGNFFDFLFSYNFTIEENTLYDEDLELNPEFLGIIFERLVNKENGAVYTPRTEVDLMCRLSLVKWLQGNVSSTINIKDLYELFFHEDGQGNGDEKDQKIGSFSQREIEELIGKLENVSVCDPAVGSGAFPVGMLHVLDGVLQTLHEMHEDKTQPTAFDRKKGIIFKSLYGVEVREWAVWITQLRLWITLFIEAPDSIKDSPVAILPSLDFKIRAGDSLIQRIANKLFPVADHPGISAKLKAKITALKNAKLDFYYNKRRDFENVKKIEISVFKEILDDEIHKRVEYIKRAKGLESFVQPSFLGAEQQQLPVMRDGPSIEAIELEIDELKKQQRDIHDEHPFVWNIEFAEIFTEEGGLGFDVVIGNPPYIRQEDIKDPKGRIATYKDLLPEMAHLDFPRHLKDKSAIDKKSDLYIYFYIRALRLLNKKGVQTFICSNSWLDIGYGEWLQKFLLNSTSMHFVIDNHAKRSFSAADVNTIITVFGAPGAKSNKQHLVKFLAFKKPFEESISSETLIKVESTNDVLSNENYRVFPVSTEQLAHSQWNLVASEQKRNTDDASQGNKWGGKYLRAPDIFWKALNANRGVLIPFTSVVHKDYGIKPGCVDFFYVDEEKRNTFKIEDRFLTPLINSSRAIDSIYFHANTHLFYCHAPKSEMKKGTLDYIQWGESQDFHQSKSVKSHRPFWYSLTGEPVDFLLLQFWDKRFWTPIAKNNSIMCSNNFFYGRCLDHRESVLFQMNSTWYFMQIELFGRANQGQGVLTTYGPDYEYIKLVDPTKFSEKDTAAGIEALKSIARRKIQPIWEEIKLPDRRALDNVIFDTLGFKKDEKEEFYSEMCRLVLNRIEKAKSVSA